MKYMLTWTERPQGSPIEYENAQKRILEVFTQWSRPRCVYRPSLLWFPQLLGDLTGTGDEKLRQRAERAVPQREDPDWMGTCR